MAAHSVWQQVSRVKHESLCPFHELSGTDCVICLYCLERRNDCDNLFSAHTKCTCEWKWKNVKRHLLLHIQNNIMLFLWVSMSCVSDSSLQGCSTGHWSPAPSSWSFQYMVGWCLWLSLYGLSPSSSFSWSCSVSISGFPLSLGRWR